jgi:hypothetical protein
MNDGKGKEGVGSFRMRCRLVVFPSLPIPPLADQFTFLLVTVNQAWRYFAASVLQDDRTYRNKKEISRAPSHFPMSSKGGISESQGGYHVLVLLPILLREHINNGHAIS